MPLINKLRSGRSDNFQTPDWPLEVLSRRLDVPTKYKMWDPCCGKGNVVSFFNKKGHYAFGTDLEMGVDFLSVQKGEIDFDFIVTNPPYSLKSKFVQKCYDLGKPFALLMPLTALEGIERQSCYKEKGLSLLCLPRRVNYYTPSGSGSGAHFASAWYTHGFDTQPLEFLSE